MMQNRHTKQEQNTNSFELCLARRRKRTDVLNYDEIIKERAQKVFSEMEKRVSTEDMARIHEAYELARKAHAEQKRKSGEPYIINPTAEWMEHVLTYKAKGFQKRNFAKQEKPKFHFCPNCHPIPGEEVVGFKEADGTITVHKRNCPIAIGLASQQGDSIVSVDYNESPETLYPVTIQILAIDRYHLLSDMINCITNDLHLSMSSLSTNTADHIVSCTITFTVHSYGELQTIISQVAGIKGVEEVKQVQP